MTTVNITVTNKATKQSQVVARFKVTHSRKHGRPRNVGKVMKGQRLALPRKPWPAKRVVREP